jgi:hypothetical protein
MRRLNTLAIAAAISILPAIAQSGSGKTRAALPEAQVLDTYRKLPLQFEANAGQLDNRIKFVSRKGSSAVFLTAGGALLALPRSSGHKTPGPAVVGMSWLGSNPAASVEGLGQFAAKTNYLIGNHPEQWRTGVANYSQVCYRNLYPGVDLLYYGKEGQLEYDLVVSAGASLDPIRFKLSGASHLKLDGAGDLIFRAGGNQIRLRRPVVYQLADSGRKQVHGSYILKGRSQVRFQVGAYDPALPLIIDPQVMYSSYLGGSGDDSGQKVALDSQGNAYIVGTTASADFPLASPYQAANGGTKNVFIAKLNPTAAGANSLVYSTYLGGSGNSIGRGIAIGALGEIIVAGDTNSPNFPVSAGAYQTSCKLLAGVCSTDVFVTKLDPTGSSLMYSTYLGGGGSEFAFALTTNAAGRIFVAGPTDSSNFPVTAGAAQSSYAGGPAKFGDAFVAELNPGGAGAADLVYSTYLGGSGSETPWGIAVDSSGDVYVTGNTTSSNFPVTAGAYQSVNSGGGNLSLGDAFVTKLNPSNQGPAGLVYSTYLGGGDDDRGESIAVDAANRIYITGFTQSTGFPTTIATAYQTTFGGGVCNGSPCGDAIIAIFDPSLSGAASLVYSTFFGGTSFDLGHAIAVDQSGLVYVAGETGSTDFPLANPIQSTCTGGCTPLPMTDAFLAKFDFSRTGTAALLFSTYLGGSDVDTPWGMAVDTAGNAYLAGQIFSTDFPMMIPYQAVCNGCVPFTSPSRSGDGFLLKICTTNCPAASVSPASVSFANQSVASTSSAQSVTLSNPGSGILTIAGITVTGTNGGDFSQTNNCSSTLGSNASCTINVTFTPSAGGARSAVLSVRDNGQATPQTVTLSGTGVAPAVGWSPVSLSFASQNTNTTSAAQNVTVTNNGPGALTISSIAITGANPGDYAQTNTCPLSPSTLAVNGTCTISVTFTPTVTGTRTASVTITDNGSGSPQAVSLTGTGVTPVPAVTLAPASLTFGTQNTNTTSAAQNVTVTNNGPGALTISSIAITGANPGDYAQTNTCPLSPSTLAVNGTCTISVTFTPTVTGTRTASVTITDNGSGSPQAVSLTGTGAGSVTAPWPNGYTYQATFTVASGKAPTAQSNFPALISGSFADFKTTANGGRIANLCTQTVGNNSISVPCDLIFTSDAAGATPLSWEFESYNPATGAVNIWVRFPTISSGTVVYAWYGKSSIVTLQTTASATWSSNFLAVYHMKEDPSGAAPQIDDSTVNSSPGTANGGMTAAQQVGGEIGGSLSFAGGSYYATLANPVNFSFERTDSWSVSLWVKPAANTSSGLLTKQQITPFVSGWNLFQRGGSSNPTMALELASVVAGSRMAVNTVSQWPTGMWHHVTATYNGSSAASGVNIYVDGVSQPLSTIADSLGTNSIITSSVAQINGRSGASFLGAATEDEVRVYAKGVVLSPGWVTAEYNNQSSPGTFFSIITGLTKP